MDGDPGVQSALVLSTLVLDDPAKLLEAVLSSLAFNHFRQNCSHGQVYAIPNGKHLLAIDLLSDTIQNPHSEQPTSVNDDDFEPDCGVAAISKHGSQSWSSSTDIAFSMHKQPYLFFKVVSSHASKQMKHALAGVRAISASNIVISWHRMVHKSHRTASVYLEMMSSSVQATSHVLNRSAFLDIGIESLRLMLVAWDTAHDATTCYALPVLPAGVDFETGVTAVSLLVGADALQDEGQQANRSYHLDHCLDSAAGHLAAFAGFASSPAAWVQCISRDDASSNWEH